ncbi:hypothetical protein DXU04_19675 [Bradyrhizobium diazoefficiens]
MLHSLLATRNGALPPPLWGRVRERGSHELRSRLGLPPSLTLPHKGGGNGSSLRRSLLGSVRA